MLTFAVISVGANTDIDQAITEKYPLNFHRVNANVCLVADIGVTAQEVCKKLGVKDASGIGIDSVMVVQISGYYGHAAKSIWEWLAVKTSST